MIRGKATNCKPGKLCNITLKAVLHELNSIRVLYG